MFLPSPGTWTLLPSIVGTLLVFVNAKAVLKEAFHSNYYYNNCGCCLLNIPLQQTTPKHT